MKLEDHNFDELEQAKEILQARIDGTAGEDFESQDERVLNAMSLIAEGYQSESEEEGEVDHIDHKKSIIEAKFKEIVKQKSVVEEDNSDVDNGSAEPEIPQSRSPSRTSDVIVLDSPVRTSSPPVAEQAKATSHKASRRSRSRSRSRRSHSPAKKRRSRSPRDKENRSPVRRAKESAPAESRASSRVNKESPPPPRRSRTPVQRDRKGPSKQGSPSRGGASPPHRASSPPHVSG